MVLQYGAADAIIMSVLFGEGSSLGKLPFDLPRGDSAVAESRSDVQYDTEDPLYRFGHGLRY